MRGDRITSGAARIRPKRRGPLPKTFSRSIYGNIIRALLRFGAQNLLRRDKGSISFLSWHSRREWDIFWFANINNITGPLRKPLWSALPTKILVALLRVKVMFKVRTILPRLCSPPLNSVLPCYEICRLKRAESHAELLTVLWQRKRALSLYQVMQL